MKTFQTDFSMFSAGASGKDASQPESLLGNIKNIYILGPESCCAVRCDFFAASTHLRSSSHCRAVLSSFLRHPNCSVRWSVSSLVRSSSASRSTMAAWSGLLSCSQLFSISRWLFSQTRESNLVCRASSVILLVRFLISFAMVPGVVVLDPRQAPKCCGLCQLPAGNTFTYLVI